MTERRAYTPYTPEKRQAIRDDVFAKLEAGVAAIQDSESFTRYLSAQAKFHHYSPNNVMLILSQRPEATMVAPFSKWLRDFERKVKKGEKSLRILAPILGKDEDTGEQVLRAFVPVPVFDVQQTEGKPLPEPEVPVLLEGEDGAQLFATLMDYATTERVKVRMVRSMMELGGANGDYNPRSRDIRIRPNPMRQMAKTLAHELSHHVHLAYIGAESAERGEKETVAEGSAFVIANHFGLETGEYSFPYVAAWAGNREVLVKQLAVIHAVSERIIDGLEGVVASGKESARTAPSEGTALAGNSRDFGNIAAYRLASHTQPRFAPPLDY